MSLIDELAIAVTLATEKHGPFASAHEAHSVMREELDEFFDEVKADAPADMLHAEAMDLAVAAFRYALQLEDTCRDLSRPPAFVSAEGLVRAIEASGAVTQCDVERVTRELSGRVLSAAKREELMGRVGASAPDG